MTMSRPSLKKKPPAVESDLPLAGRRIVVTRAVHQAGELASLLRLNAGDALLYPCIAIEPVKDARPLDEGIRSVIDGEFDWLVLTSANVVRSIASHMQSAGIEFDDIRGIPIAAIGPATAEAAQKLLGVNIDLMPAQYIAESLAAALQPIDGSRIFLPQADLARPALARALRRAGAEVVTVVAYRTVPGHGGIDLPSMLLESKIDAVTLTSASTAENFNKRLIAEGGALTLLDRVCIASIGPITTRTAQSLGLPVTVEPKHHTLESLVGSLADYFAKGRTKGEGPA